MGSRGKMRLKKREKCAFKGIILFTVVHTVWINQCTVHTVQSSEHNTIPRLVYTESFAQFRWDHTEPYFLFPGDHTEFLS